MTSAVVFWHEDISPEAGPYTARLRRGAFVDKAREGRTVPYKIYTPDAPAGYKAPVIIWSHGFGGSRDGAAFLSRYLASYGYILVHLTHVGTDSSLWEGKAGHPWDILRQTKITRETTLARFEDVPFMLDQLEVWTGENPETGAMMDFEKLGMSGHSFGALTTQIMAGQLFPGPDNELIRMKEERFKAGIAYSPIPIAHLTDVIADKLYGPIDVPLLHMTGTADHSPLESRGHEHRLVVYEHTAHPEKYLLIKAGGDHMVYNGTRGKLATNPARERHEEIIKLISLAFWEAQLKGDAGARQWLRDSAPTWLDEDGKIKGA